MIDSLRMGKPITETLALAINVRMEGTDMGKVQYEGSEQFKPISSWGYVGYSILFCIPVIGWIIWIVFAFSGGNINRRSYARSYFCWFLLSLILFAAATALAVFDVGGFRRTLRQWNIPYINEAVDQVDRWRAAGQSASPRPTETGRAARPTATPPGETKRRQDGPAVTAAPRGEAAGQSTGAVGVRREVKEAVDGYEDFFREYTDFMVKYSKSTNSMGMMTDYANMLTKYAENMEKWEKLDRIYSMNDAELKYYTEATLRIEKMLLDAAQ